MTIQFTTDDTDFTDSTDKENPHYYHPELSSFSTIFEVFLKTEEKKEPRMDANFRE
jgi:hypothetical protein